MSPGGIGLGLPQPSGAPSNTVFVVNIFGGGDVTGNVAVFDATEKSPYGIVEPLLDSFGTVKSNPITGNAGGHQIGFYPVTPIALRIPAKPDGPVFSAASPCLATLTAKTGEPIVPFTVTASIAPNTYYPTLELDVTGLPAGASSPPASAPLIVSSAFNWTPVVGDELESPYGLTYTATDEFAQTATCPVTINVVKPTDPGGIVPFDAFSAKIKIEKKKGKVHFHGKFTLNAAFLDGIDPPNEEVIVELDDFLLVICHFHSSNPQRTRQRARISSSSTGSSAA